MELRSCFWKTVYQIQTDKWSDWQTEKNYYYFIPIGIHNIPAQRLVFEIWLNYKKVYKEYITTKTKSNSLAEMC